MFDNILAKVRIGAAEVDTRLEDQTLCPGEPFSAQVVVEGGNTDQEIEGLELRLVAELNRGSEEHTKNQVMDSWHVGEGEFTIHEGEQKVIPFEAQLPYETPVTSMSAPKQYSKVWIHTGLDIDDALDAKDKDYLTVHPTSTMKSVLDAVEAKGYSRKEISLDPDQIRVNQARANLPVDQEFVYRPPTSKRNSGLKEIEVHFLPRPEKTHVLIESDYKRKSEQFESVTLNNDASEKRIKNDISSYL